MCQTWATVPLQSQIWSCVPSAGFAPGSSRQRPELGLRSDPSERTCQTWAPVPLQVHSWTFVPFAVPAPVTSMHFPSARIVPSPVLDHAGMAIDPRLYAPDVLPEMGRGPLDAFLGYALSAVFLGASWTLAMLPGSNFPFATLDYEAWYYVLFGLAAFLRGRRRMAALAAAALLAGPKILLLFPIWLMGVAAEVAF